MTEANVILGLLAPPLRLVIYLEKMFAMKQGKGETVPEEFTEWMQRWADIRGDGMAVTDYLPDEVWEQLAERVA
jgi:hypothetical protein